MQWFNFELGIYNAYIPMVLLMFIPKIISLFLKKDISRALIRPKMNRNESIIYNIWFFIFYLILGISIFLPFVNNDKFLIGLLLSSISFISYIFGNYSYQATPKDTLVKTGIYKLSRNPGYFNTTIYFLGVSLMTNSLLLLSLTLAFFILYQITVKFEERMCEELYKKEYLEYKNKTAKNFLFF